jgi:hypothetical protein
LVSDSEGITPLLVFGFGGGDRIFEASLSGYGFSVVMLLTVWLLLIG